MEPRRYISLAYWAKDRIARLEPVSIDLVEGAEMDAVQDTNIVSFGASVELVPSQMEEAA
jgi:hypothetical protein